MGREVKRVVSGFDWPLGTTWEGYLNPFYKAVKCEHCDGTGLSAEAKGFQDQWYGYVDFDPSTTGSVPFGQDHPIIQKRAERNILWDFQTGLTRKASPEDKRAIARESKRLAEECFDNRWCHHLSQQDVDALVAHGRLHDFTETFVPGEGWKKKDPPHHPTAKEVNLWSIESAFGHDAINQWVCVEERCKREGVPHRCSHCHGEGHSWPSKAAKTMYESWTNIEPPTGTAYQIWETTTEGSPITPAFDSAEQLADWCVENQMDKDNRPMIDGQKWNRIAGGTGSLDKEQWLKFILGDVPAMSTVITNGVVQSGVEFLVHKEDKHV